MASVPTYLVTREGWGNVQALLSLPNAILPSNNVGVAIHVASTHGTRLSSITARGMMEYQFGNTQNMRVLVVRGQVPLDFTLYNFPVSGHITQPAYGSSALPQQCLFDFVCQPIVIGSQIEFDFQAYLPNGPIVGSGEDMTVILTPLGDFKHTTNAFRIALSLSAYGSNDSPMHTPATRSLF